MVMYITQGCYVVIANPFAGAVQCAKCCTRCRIGVWQKTQRGMINHWRSNHNGECQLPKKDDNISGPENVIVSESCWCIKGINDDGTAAVDNGGGNWVPCTERLNSIRKLVAFLFIYIACSCILLYFIRIARKRAASSVQISQLTVPLVLSVSLVADLVDDDDLPMV